MRAVAGPSWTLTYPTSSIAWTAPRPPRTAMVADIEGALAQESGYAPAATDPYTAGKELARLARLELMARELGATALADTPFTPASEDLLDPAWITDAWSQMSAAATSATEQGWKGFMYMAHAVIDRTAATGEVAKLTGYDNGNSRANTLYWLATRP